MPPITNEFFGLLVVGLMILFQFYWNWKRDAREERKDAAPKPPLHDVYATKREMGELLKQVERLETNMSLYFKRNEERLAEGNDRFGSMEGKVDTISAQLAQLAGQTATLIDRVGEVRGELKRMA
jgi:hypothetical protein